MYPSFGVFWGARGDLKPTGQEIAGAVSTWPLCVGFQMLEVFMDLLSKFYLEFWSVGKAFLGKLSYHLLNTVLALIDII